MSTASTEARAGRARTTSPPDSTHVELTCSSPARRSASSPRIGNLHSQRPGTTSVTGRRSAEARPEPRVAALGCLHDPGPARPAAARPAHLGHRPVQLPLRLLHAEGGLRARTTEFLPRASCSRSRRSSASRAYSSATASRSSGSPAASRSCGGRRAAGRDAAIRRRDLTLTTNGSLLAPKAQALAAAGLRAHHRQPRLARRRHVPRDERRRLPRPASARRHRRGGRRRPAGQGERRRQARHQRRTSILELAALLPRHAATRCASSSTWTSARRTAGGSTTSSRPPRSSSGSTRSSRSSRSSPRYRGEVAQRWRYRDGGGEIGVIASVTQPFCGDCTRARLSAEGRLYTCLFAHARPRPARARPRRRHRRRARRGDRPRSGRGAPIATPRCARRHGGLPKVEMSYIGG